ncbi:aminopeptidase M1-like isoform X3 [Magnolia sinica]|uniref:aminopeptidase M1-like isoform X3 n=1 Tax=Magnolia sinica TaxID=86752 RepID=UPI002657C2F7|nr:aminopeptidase M1-like isoform X3 [Magnolia sinica]
MAETKNAELQQFKGQPRLPKFVVPKRYDLKLRPDLSACKFTGTVNIDVDVTAKTRFIVLNAADLSINDGSVWFKTQQSHKARTEEKGLFIAFVLALICLLLREEIDMMMMTMMLSTTMLMMMMMRFLRRRREVYRPSEVVLVEEDEILVLAFDGFLPVGKGILGIRFSGTLNDEMKGFYRSTYEHDGEKKNMAVTQFEAVDARRCFPCWDEPAVKATFKITLEVPSELMALSNMPVIQEKLHGKLKTVSFQESPIMSTYLVAIIVGLFDYIEGLTLNGTKVRVYCQIGKTNQGKFAFDVAVRTLDLYESYFSMPYSLPKLDMIAIPDFAYGAMENYGLVTYRETALLYDDQHSATANKQMVAIVVTHELAHQWFGNLVTMEWWTHLWLNEGFATWVSYLATDCLFPEWKIWTQFIDQTTEGLRLDGLAESHPIEVEINHAHEIDEIFDAISYKKGASLIRMLQNYLGAECFQSQFLSSGLLGDGQWIVPITLCCGSYDTRKNFLLQTKSDRLEISELVGSSNESLTEEWNPGEGDEKNPFWYKINIDQTGFYRVKYDDQLAARLRYAIRASCLSATDRFGILDDSYALCMACKQTLSSLLSLMDAYREELDYTVLSCLITICSEIVKIVADATPESSDDIKQFFIHLLQFSAGKLGWQPNSGESHLDAMLRGELLTALALFGHDITQTEAVRRFYTFVDDRNTSLLPADTRKAAYVAVMQTVTTSNRSGYECLRKVYRETDLSQEKMRILSSLASCPDPDIVLEALNFLLSSEVRSQDVIYGLAGISREGREIAWRWLKDNWDHISKTWGSGILITRFIRAIVSPFCSEDKADEVEEFFARRIKPSRGRTLKQSIERVRINAKWVQSIKSEKRLGEIVKELAHPKY